MKRMLCLLVLSVAVVLSLSMAASASQIKFTDVPGPETTIDNGIGAGIYHGTLNGVPTNFICDDATHDISKGESWYVNEYYLSGVNDVATQHHGMFAGGPSPHTTASGADLPNPTVQQDYNMVAYLAYEILSHTITDPHEVGAIQWAIWDIMDHPTSHGIADPGGHNCSHDAYADSHSSCGDYWVDKAWATESNYTNPHIVFYTPAGKIIGKCSYPQELIGLTATPEPLSLILMGTFMTLAGGVLGKKKLSS
jgi:hypothetical protein